MIFSFNFYILNRTFKCLHNTSELQSTEIISALKLKTSNINDALSDYNMLSPGCNKKLALFTLENTPPGKNYSRTAVEYKVLVTTSFHFCIDVSLNRSTLDCILKC